MESLIGRELVDVHLAAPETLPVETDVPVGNIVADEILNQAARGGDVIVLIGGHDLLLQCVEQRDDPPVDLRSFRICHLRRLRIESVHIGIESEE